MRLKNQKGSMENPWNLKSCQLKRELELTGITIQWCIPKKSRHGDSTEISDLPIDCIAQILSFTSPRDVCVLSLVSHMFKSAAEFDLVWEKFLPLGYKDIISKLSLDINCFSSNKKDVFHRLCTAQILFDAGNKSLTIDTNGKINLMIGSRELVVNWNVEVQWDNSSGRAQSIGCYGGGIIDHGRWLPVSDSRFPYAIELITDYWDKISGKIDVKLLSPATNYLFYIIYKFAKDAKGFEPEEGDYKDAHVYGCAKGTINFVRGVDGASGDSELHLQEDSRPWDKSIEPSFSCKSLKNPTLLKEGCNTRTSQEVTHPSTTLAQARLTSCKSILFEYEYNEDTWFEVKLGHFYNDKGDDGEVLMIFSEDSDYWKCRMWMEGLIVQGIHIRCDDGEEQV